MFGPVQTKLDELTTKRFINCLVGSGKTTQLIWVINTILSKGETCLLVTPETYLIKSYFPDNKLPEGLSVIHIDKLLKYLKNYHEDNMIDAYNISYKQISLFNCDRIVIDPKCYIKMIEQYMERFQKLDEIIEKIKHI